MTNIFNQIKQLSLDPKPHGYKKLTGYKNLYRIRIGLYRVVYLIENQILTIEIIKIGHRKDDL